MDHCFFAKQYILPTEGICKQHEYPHHPHTIHRARIASRVISRGSPSDTSPLPLGASPGAGGSLCTGREQQARPSNQPRQPSLSGETITRAAQRNC